MRPRETSGHEEFEARPSIEQVKRLVANLFVDPRDGGVVTFRLAQDGKVQSVEDMFVYHVT